MSFPPCEIIKENSFSISTFSLLCILELLKNFPLTNQKTRSRALFDFLVLLSIIPSVHGCYSRINRIKFEIPKSMTAKKSVKNTTVAKNRNRIAS